MLKGNESPALLTFMFFIERSILKVENFFKKPVNQVLEFQICIILDNPSLNQFSEIEKTSNFFKDKKILVLLDNSVLNLVALGNDLSNVYYIPFKSKFKPNSFNSEDSHLNYFYFDINKSQEIDINGMKKVDIPDNHDSLCCIAEKIIHLDS
jgi:hypothetical protein